MTPETVVDIDDDDVLELRLYECAVLYPVILTQKEEADFLKATEEIFEEAGAKLVSKDVWGQRGIAYPIKGHVEGKFVIYHYEMDPAKLREIDQALRIQKNMMRHLIVKPPKGYKIVKWSELYEKWLKERETVDQVRTREKEEKVREQVARKAKKQADRSTERKRTDEVKPAMEEGQLTEKLEKLISDDTFDSL